MNISGFTCGVFFFFFCYRSFYNSPDCSQTQHILTFYSTVTLILECKIHLFKVCFMVINVLLACVYRVLYVSVGFHVGAGK